MTVPALDSVSGVASEEATVTTLTRTRPIPTGLSLWWSVPMTVRRVLQARVPLEAAAVGGSKLLVVSVGGGSPLRWLVVGAEDDGRLAAALHEVRRTGTKLLAEAVVTADRLPPLLQTWAAEFGLSA